MLLPPPRPPGPILRLALLTFLTILATAASPIPGQEAAKEDRAGRLAEMKELVGAFRVTALDGKTATPLELKKEPLFRWNDPTRKFNDGSLWAFGTRGRPAAIMGVELYPHPELVAIWSFEFVSTSTGRIEIAGGEDFRLDWGDTPPIRPDGQVRWVPRAGGVAFAAIPGAPPPAADAAGRLLQIKELTRRFSAREFHLQEITLRLLPRPIDRYADAASGLIDGAIFVFANGTNPEDLLLIEAQGREPASATWQYAVARLALAESSVSLDGKVIWSQPRPPRLKADDPYCIYRKVRTSRAEP